MGWNVHPLRTKIVEQRRATSMMKEMLLTIKSSPANPGTPLEGTWFATKGEEEEGMKTIVFFLRQTKE
jgi:hypothetical protein